MEKFFKVKPNTNFYDKYMDFVHMSEKIGNAFKEFAATHNIDTNQFYMNANQLVIVPTEKDKETFAGMFLKNSETDFKKTTKINKEWVQLCKDKGIVTPRKPSVLWDTKVNLGCYSYSQRLFHIGDMVLGSVDNKIDYNFTLTDEFEEIKASEFYRIIEEAEEKGV